MLINAIYLANQQQTAESLLMIIIYIYTHYVHAVPLQEAAPPLFPPACAPGPVDPRIRLPLPQTSAQVSKVSPTSSTAIDQLLKCDSKGLFLP